MTWVAVCVFSVILFVVLFAFQPARELVCAKYEVRGLERLLSFLRGDETNCLRGLLYDFQTLITGFAAVAAASATVIVAFKTEKANAERHQKNIETAQETENKNAARHQKNVELTLRPDKLRVERMLIPHLGHLKLLAKSFESLSWNSLQNPSEWEIFVRVIRQSPNLRPTLQHLRAMPAKDAWKKAEDLLDGQTTETIQRLQNLLMRYIDVTEFTTDESFVKDNYQEAMRLTFHAWRASQRSRIAKIPQFHREIEEIIVELIDRLESMAATYEIKLDHLTPSPDQS